MFKSWSCIARIIGANKTNGYHQKSFKITRKALKDAKSKKSISRVMGWNGDKSFLLQLCQNYIEMVLVIGGL